MREREREREREKEREREREKGAERVNARSSLVMLSVHPGPALR